MAQGLQGILGGRHFGVLLGGTGPLADDVAVGCHLNGEDRLVFAAALVKEVVGNIDVTVALQEFLQAGLGIAGVVKPALD